MGLDQANHASSTASRRIVTVHGWPGVGKTSLVSRLCHDGEVLECFSGGIFFLPVGRAPDIRRLTQSICGVLEIPAPPGAPLDELRGRIANALSQRRVLLVFDDVWEEEHVVPLSLAGRSSATLVTTRRLDVATRLAPTAEGVFKLDVLSEDDSLELLRAKIPDIVAGKPEACRELAMELDGLPLALRVAADLLRVEAGAGFSVAGLLSELREAARLLDEEAPADAAFAAGLEPDEIGPPVRALLQKSVERMGQDMVRRFARLGVLPPKPLSFDQWTASEVWDEAPGDEPSEEGPSEEHKRQTREALGELVRRGLVEPTVPRAPGPAQIERFQMHALVAAFALETLHRTEGESGVSEVQQRRLEHYINVVGATADALSMGGPNQFFGL